MSGDMLAVVAAVKAATGGGGGAAPTIVRRIPVVFDFGTASPVFSLDGAPTSGNAIVLAIPNRDRTVTSVVDSASNSYTQLGSNAFVTFWCRTNITNAPTTVTVNHSDTMSLTGLVAWEIAGINNSTPLHVAANGNFPSTTNPSAGLTTTVNNKLVLAVMTVGGFTNREPVVTSPSTLHRDSGGGATFLWGLDRTVATAAATTLAVTYTGGDTSAAEIDWAAVALSGA